MRHASLADDGEFPRRHSEQGRQQLDRQAANRASGLGGDVGSETADRRDDGRPRVDVDRRHRVTGAVVDREAHREEPFAETYGPGTLGFELNDEASWGEDRPWVELLECLERALLGRPQHPAQALRGAAAAERGELFGGEDALVKARMRGVGCALAVLEIDDVVSDH